MRLTLRTLLAYLDEILDPQDAEVLRKKIQESEFATNLVHQIRGSVRRLRLESPLVDAQGIGGDLNSVAEYLDNTLPPEQVPILEKVCLDHESHLGEVASCHQILTLVLGQAAQVDDTTRRRIYNLAPTMQHSQPLPGQVPPGRQASPGSQGSPVGRASPAIRRLDPAPTKTDSVRSVPELPPATPVVLPSVESIPSPKPISNGGSTIRFRDPAHLPSTKDTWRAEGKYLDSALTPATQDPLQDPVSVALPTPVEPRTSTARTDRTQPEYMPRQRSSGLRTLTLSTLVAFLIAMALMAAAGPQYRDRLLSIWYGKSGISTALRTNARGHASDSSTKVPMAPVAPTTLDSGPRADSSTLSPADFRSSSEEASDATFPSRADMLVAPESGEPGLNEPIHELLHPAESSEVATETETIETEEAPSLANVESDSAIPETNAAGLRIPETLVAPVDDIRDSVPEPTVVREEERFANMPPPDPTPDGHEADLTGLTPPTGIEVDAEFVPDPIQPPVATAAANAPGSHDLRPGLAADSLPNTEPTAPEPSDAVQQPAQVKQGGQLLLLLDASTQQWQLVQAGTALAPGDAVMSLPAFRAAFELGSSNNCTLVGPSRAYLTPSGIELVDGRAILQLVSDQLSQDILVFEQPVRIRATSAGAKVSVDVASVHLPGVEPEKETPQRLFRIHAMDDPLTVKIRNQEYTIPPKHHLLSLNDFEPRVQQDESMPSWIVGSDVPRTDEYSAQTWKRSIKDITDLRLWLKEKATTRQYNERALAARCLAELDQFDAIIAAINDEEQHSYSAQHYESLQRAIARGAETATKIRFEIEKVHAADGESLFEMIRGYDQRQLAAGGAVQLVKALEHPTLDYRVLAIENLRRITGSDLAFHPWKLANKRTLAVKSWKKKLNRGEVTFKHAPEIIQIVESFKVE